MSTRKTKKPPKKPDRRGRPPRPMPERIDASPEEIAQRCLAAPVPKQWKYIQGDERP